MLYDCTGRLGSHCRSTAAVLCRMWSVRFSATRACPMADRCRTADRLANYSVHCIGEIDNQEAGACVRACVRAYVC